MEGVVELKEPKVRDKNVEPKSPQIAFKIFYGAHQTEKNQEGLKKAFEEADIYAPEIPGWTPKTLDIFQSVSEGRLGPADGVRLLGSFFPKLAELTMLYDSKKPVVFMDVPVKDSIFWKTVDELSKLAKLTDSLALNKDFRGYLEDIRNAIKGLAQTQKDREDYMLSHLRPKIAELLKERPELNEKERLGVLLNLGAVHTNLYRSLKKNDQEVDRTFNDMPTIFSHTEEGIRRFLFDKGIGDELAAKIFLELLFKNELEKNKMSRAIFSQVSIEDAEDLFNRAKRGEDPKLLFDSMFEAKGAQKLKARKDAEELLVPV